MAVISVGGSRIFLRMIARSQNLVKQTGVWRTTRQRLPTNQSSCKHFTKRSFKLTNVHKQEISCQPLRRQIHQSSSQNHDFDAYSHSVANANKHEVPTESIVDASFEETIKVSQPDLDARNCQNTTNRTNSFIDGELAMIIKEDVKKHTSLKAIVKLTDDGIFTCKYGAIPHRNIIGQTSGREFLTSQRLPVLIRRPTLDDYVLRMQRIPVISFPKDICTMLMMIDASPGDVFLEAGTGSGAVALFLSKAAGYRGKIHTMEVKKTHRKLAMRNFNRWKDSWNLSHDCKWTSNVEFHQGCLIKDGCDMFQDITFDGAIIDMEECHAALPVIAGLLKNGGAVCLYVVNVTQVIEILEMIRIKELPFSVEAVVEVGQRYWFVNAARRRSGTIVYSTVENEALTDEEVVQDKPGPKVPKYIAKPSNEGTEHSAFLVKVVKLECYPSSYKI